jgi:hypothetical protein
MEGSNVEPKTNEIRRASIGLVRGDNGILWEVNGKLHKI